MTKMIRRRNRRGRREKKSVHAVFRGWAMEQRVVSRL